MRLFLSCVASCMIATSALASGPVVPPTPPVTPPIPVAHSMNWEGAYGGVSLGYNAMRVDDLSFGPGPFNANGASLIGFAGYNFQRGSLVFGPELGLSVNTARGTDGFFMRPFRMRNSIELRGRVGVAAGRALPYLALGVISSEFWADHAGAGNPVDFARARFNGVTLAAGVDVAVNQSMFVRGEIQAVRYRNGVLPFYAGTDPHTLSARDVRLSVGVGWRF